MTKKLVALTLTLPAVIVTGLLVQPYLIGKYMVEQRNKRFR